MKAKRLAALLMALILVVGMLSVTASAVAYCGTCSQQCSTSLISYIVLDTYNVGPCNYMGYNHQHTDRIAKVRITCPAGHTRVFDKTVYSVCPHNSSWYY